MHLLGGTVDDVTAVPFEPSTEGSSTFSSHVNSFAEPNNRMAEKQLLVRTLRHLTYSFGLSVCYESPLLRLSDSVGELFRVKTVSVV